MIKRTLFFILCFYFISCNEANNEGFSGGINEILVVVDEIYNIQEIKKLIESKNKFFVGLPQNEHTFDIIYIKSSGFTSIFKKQKNIILITQSDQEFLRVFLNEWTESQKVFCFSSQNLSFSFIYCFFNISFRTEIKNYGIFWSQV